MDSRPQGYPNIEAAMRSAASGTVAIIKYAFVGYLAKLALDAVKSSERR
jgi:hypothetical protein